MGPRRAFALSAWEGERLEGDDVRCRIKCDTSFAREAHGTMAIDQRLLDVRVGRAVKSAVDHSLEECRIECMRSEKRSRGARRRRDGAPNETFKRGEWNPIEHRRRARRRRRRRAAHARGRRRCPD